jgi:serine/threonine protein kinase
MAEFNGWEKIKSLGEGGQSTVFLARSPERATQRVEALKAVGELVSGINNPARLIENIGHCLREDALVELGALKVFDKVRRSGADPGERIRREMDILRSGYANLPKLRDGDLDGKWMVTEYFPDGTLDKSPGRFKGDASEALKAFRPLVETIGLLHNHKIVHRDIKPANVFIGSEGQLVIGDFGIAYDEVAKRVTVTHERVGPWDYMPQWGDTGERLEKVEPSIDIYMLGKLLWCMVSGKLRLPREYHRRDEYDLSQIFPSDRKMRAINSILDKCIVEHEPHCLRSTSELLESIDEALETFKRTAYLNEKGELSLPCYVCGTGTYIEETKDGGKVRLERLDSHTRPQGAIDVRVFSCNVCTHRAFFSLDAPDEAFRHKHGNLSFDDCVGIVVASTPHPDWYTDDTTDSTALFDLGVVGTVDQTHFVGLVNRKLKAKGYEIDATLIVSAPPTFVQDSAQSLFDNAMARS